MMSSKPEWLVVVTYREWLNWIAHGRLRIGKRRIRYTADISASTFRSLMKKAPDVSQSEDQAYLIAVLKSTRLNKESDVVITLPDDSSVPISSVVSFHPMSHRGATLLQGDAKRAYTILNEPLCEYLWDEWVSNNARLSRHVAANCLTRACNLPGFDDSGSADDNVIFSILKHPINCLRVQVKDIEKQILEKQIKKYSKFHRQPAYAWWLALRVYKELLAEDMRAIFAEEANSLREYLSAEFQSIEALNRPVTSWTEVSDFSDRVTEKYGIDACPTISLLQLAIIYHYQHVIAELGTIELSALHDDLSVLKQKQGVAAAALVAHFIGWHLDCSAATGLLYASTSDESSFVIDVERLPRMGAVAGQQQLTGT